MRTRSIFLTLSLSLGLAACGDKPGVGGDDSGDSDDPDGDGYTGDDDCDEENDAAHVGAVERCDGFDNNCDGNIDEGLANPWYTDADGDGFGDSATSQMGCFPTEDHSTSIDGDCDDSDPRVHPAGTEVCDGLDNDCNGQVDDPSMFDYDTYFADTDGDTYGDPGNTTEACSQPLGYVENDIDCDDADDSVYPGAAEDGGTGTGGADGIDNDCDGAIDDNLRYGTGADGAVSISDGTFADIGGACSEVWSITADQIVVSDASAFGPGDRAMVLALQGRTTETEHVGRWTLVDVESVDTSTSTITALENVSGSFGPDNTQLRSHTVAVLRVPQVTDLTVTGTLTADPFDGNCGGAIAVLATGTIDISGGIDLAQAGYPGGDENNSHDSSGRGGESIEGRGDKATTATMNGAGGGGTTAASCSDCTGNGGGGGHAEDGLAGETNGASTGNGGDGGGAIGETTLQRIFMGGGGGGGALDTTGEDGIGGAGGGGGGILLLRGNTLNVTGVLDATGADGTSGCAAAINDCGHGTQSEAGSGGGGAGGSVYLVANRLNLAADSILAAGGAGAEDSAVLGYFGGDGAPGRVRLDYSAINGESWGASGAEDAEESSSDPDPGYSSSL
jgi:hypothetical protein